MAESLVFTNSRGQSLTIGDSPPYFLNEFDKGAPKSTLITTKAPGQDGKTLEGQMLEERTPQITLYIRANSASELATYRQTLLSVFSPKLSGTILYTNEAKVTRAIACVVEDEPTAKKAVGCHQQVLIQLFCPDPYWLNENETVHQIAQWVGDFHFPIVIPADKGIMLGHRLSNLIVNCYNPGDIEIGMRVEFTALATVQSPSILNINTREIIKVNRSLAAGDKLIINTAFDNETVRLIHGIENINALNYIDISFLTTQDDLFFLLHEGDNILRYAADNGLDNLECAIYYTPKYLGA